MSEINILLYEQYSRVNLGYYLTETVLNTNLSIEEQHAGKETLHFDWFAPHFRHRFVTNLHYDGTIQRHLGARTNQSAIRNQPT